MRDRLLLSAGHALLAMCGFVWLYSMVIALTPDAGRSAPNTLFCGVAVFAIVFVTSQARLRLAHRRLVANARSRPELERVVLDGSLATISFADAPVERQEPHPRGEIVVRDDNQRRPEAS